MLISCNLCKIPPNPNQTFDTDSEWEYTLEEMSVTDYTASETINAKNEPSDTKKVSFVEPGSQTDAPQHRGSYFFNVFGNPGSEKTLNGNETIQKTVRKSSKIISGIEALQLPNLPGVLRGENEKGDEGIENVLEKSDGEGEEDSAQETIVKRASLFHKRCSHHSKKSEGGDYDPDFSRKALQRNSLTKMLKEVHHAGTFNTLIFKGVAYKKPQKMLDLEKIPPKLDFTGQPFKVNEDEFTYEVEYRDYSQERILHRGSEYESHLVWLG